MEAVEMMRDGNVEKTGSKRENFYLPVRRIQFLCHFVQQVEMKETFVMGQK